MKYVLMFGLMAILGVSGCQKSQRQEYAGVDGDYVNGTPLPPRQEGTSFFSNNVAKGQFSPIYFDFDQSQVSSAQSAKVQEIAAYLKSASNSVILAGFTDERGTEEYNRALGERRAQAVRNALLAQGISPAKIQTVSFGLEMPAAPGHDEAAWARNRRVETGVVR